MKAARLNRLGHALQIEDIERPVLHRNGVIVRVLSAHMMSYTHEVFSGQSARIQPPVPYTPGLSAIGLVESVGADVNGIRQGDLVFCSPHLVDAAPGRAPEQILIGWFGLTPGAGKLLAQWKNGSFAEFAGYPAACVTTIPNSLKDRHAELATLNVLTVAYGALLRGGFKPGMSVLVNGATGNIGACTVFLAAALGAHKVVCLGRNRTVLSQLLGLGPMVESVTLDELAASAGEAGAAAGGQADLVIDASGAHDPKSTELALAALAYGGTAVWVGGVRADIAVPYTRMVTQQQSIIGSYMYERDCAAALVNLIATGTLDLTKFRIDAFGLDAINEAIAQAPAYKGLSAVVVQP